MRRVSGSVDQFYYDGNGNMIADSLNGTYNISYDHRNLIVQLYYKREVEENERMVLRTFSEFYKYDDTGNRIKKVVMKYTGEAQDPTIEDSGDAPPGWNYELIQHYVRDVTGNELAVYNDTTVVFWNVYGLDNVGKINYSDDSWNYYLKDHLGSVRVVIDQNADIISAEDLDMWGYRMTDRVFQSDTSFYKYTGKERDVSTGYDCFGARYYSSRIGRWGGVEPLLEKYLSFSVYAYSLDNPLNLFDINGKDVRFSNDGYVGYYKNMAINYLPHVINEALVPYSNAINTDGSSFLVTDISTERAEMFTAFTGVINLTDEKGEIIYTKLGIALQPTFFEHENLYISALLFDHELWHLVNLESIIEGIHFKGDLAAFDEWSKSLGGRYSLANQEIAAIKYTIERLDMLYNSTKYFSQSEYTEVRSTLTAYLQSEQKKARELFDEISRNK